MPEEIVFGLPVKLFLLFAFIVIFFMIMVLITPSIREGIFAFIFNFLEGLNKLFGGI